MEIRVMPPKHLGERSRFLRGFLAFSIGASHYTVRTDNPDERSSHMKETGAAKSHSYVY